MTRSYCDRCVFRHRRSSSIVIQRRPPSSTVVHSRHPSSRCRRPASFVVHRPRVRRVFVVAVVGVVAVLLLSLLQLLPAELGMEGFEIQEVRWFATREKGESAAAVAVLLLVRSV